MKAGDSVIVEATPEATEEPAEEADATARQKAINLVNTGIYCVDRTFLESALRKIQPNNAQGEYYLTKLPAIIKENGGKVVIHSISDTDEAMGANTPEDLAKINDILEMRRA